MTLNEIERALRELRLSGIRATLETRILQAQANQAPLPRDLRHDPAGRTRSASFAPDRASLPPVRPGRARYAERFRLVASIPNCPARPASNSIPLKFIAVRSKRLIIGKPRAPVKVASPRPSPIRPPCKVIMCGSSRPTAPLPSTRSAAAPISNDNCSPGSRPICSCSTICSSPDASATAPGELLQTLVHQRYKTRRSIVVTSNRVVQDWGKYLGDNTMATTILGRLMHRSHLLEFEGKSYRLKEAATRFALQPVAN